MVYIPNTNRRIYLMDHLRDAADLEELSFTLTQLALDYLPTIPDGGDYVAVVGALEAVKLEFFRRAAMTFADTKLKINGDIGYEDLPQNR